MIFRKLTVLLYISVFAFLAQFCNNSSNSSNQKNIVQTDTSKNNNQNIQLIFETLPEGKKEFKINETPLIKVKSANNMLFDSIQIYFNKKRILTLKTLPSEINLTEKIERIGQSDIEANIFKSGSSISQKFPLTFLSDIEPKTYGYQVIKTYPHDKKAYTQGLVFDNGFLYEATGLKGESTLRKVQLTTGETLQSFTIPPDIFGEGITIFNDKIIQLSWQSYVGFVYDKKTFQLITKFSYTTEGWGITNDGKNLIMSDGTNRLFFLDPQSYSEIDRIEVCDNKGTVDELNELEYINGEIYANIYRTSKIARIDPKTGKVLAYIDLSKILPDKDYEQDTDVLNGIAYDPSGKRLFVTGKRWPKLFEIKLK